MCEPRRYVERLRKPGRCRAGEEILSKKRFPPRPSDLEDSGYLSRSCRGVRVARGGLAACGTLSPMSVLSYQVRRLQSTEEMEAALALRHEVFCREQGVPRNEELDGRDHDGVHLVAVAGEELVGTCR